MLILLYEGYFHLSENEKSTSRAENDTNMTENSFRASFDIPNIWNLSRWGHMQTIRHFDYVKTFLFYSECFFLFLTVFIFCGAPELQYLTLFLFLLLQYILSAIHPPKKTCTYIQKKNTSLLYFLFNTYIYRILFIFNGFITFIVQIIEC